MELQVIQSKIFELRGRRVMLDADLAVLYGIETRVLNQTVKRNIKRFPEDFMFQITAAELESLMSQIATSNLISQIVISKRGGTRKLPYAFTEQGVAMLSGLLNSDTAIAANISIMRAFVAMRNYLMSTAAMSAELVEIRTKLALLERNDEVLACNDERLQRDNEDTLEAVNDLSEDIRHEVADLYKAFGALSQKVEEHKKAEKPRRPIGFVQQQ